MYTQEYQVNCQNLICKPFEYNHDIARGDAISFKMRFIAFDNVAHYNYLNLLNFFSLKSYTNDDTTIRSVNKLHLLSKKASVSSDILVGHVRRTSLAYQNIWWCTSNFVQ